MIKINGICLLAIVFTIGSGCTSNAPNACDGDREQISFVISDGSSYDLQLGDSWLEAQRVVASDGTEENGLELVASERDDVVQLTFDCFNETSFVVDGVYVECDGGSARVFATPTTVVVYPTTAAARATSPAGNTFDVVYQESDEGCGVNGFSGELIPLD